MRTPAIAFTALALALASLFPSAPPATAAAPRWHEKYDVLRDLPAITFHYDHGVLAGSYPAACETTTVAFEDVSRYLGHVCLCGAGGFRISQAITALLAADGAPLERGDFDLVSSRDHTVADVVGYVLGCARRDDPATSQHFIDDSIPAARREYHYYVGYRPRQQAVHVIYRKHLLVGNELMDRLWEVEKAFEEHPTSVTREDKDLYQKMMAEMVLKVLRGDQPGLIEARIVDYGEFQSRLERLKSRRH